MTMFFDTAHGAHRDVLRMWRDNGLYGFVLVTLMVINLAHGPEDTDMRYEQVKASSAHLFSTAAGVARALPGGLVGLGSLVVRPGAAGGELDGGGGHLAVVARVLCVPQKRRPLQFE